MDIYEMIKTAIGKWIIDLAEGANSIRIEETDKATNIYIEL